MTSRFLVSCLLAVTACGPRSKESTKVVEASYVGRTACVACHAAQDSAWAGSHHDLAMQPADSSTVLGDFEDRTVVNHGVRTSFFRRGGAYWVRTDGPDGNLAEYQVAYTFGVYPLQQYLVPFPRGRYQALPIAWDSRPRNEGGQRWFHLYPDETIGPRDVLHWTGLLQNWNFMCAECHSTDLRKGYVAAADSYATTWSEIDVSCEACHGPGSEHVKQRGGGALKDSLTVAGGQKASGASGLVVDLRPVAVGTWVFDSGKSIAHRSEPLASHAEVETCAYCHSRRSDLWQGHEPGELLEQTHRVAVLDEPLYWPDGQQRDEVYEYGSFLQSRMYRAGVTCSDCHDAHSARTRAAGNALCARCHLAAKYDDPSHHHHRPGTVEARCVSCHMPTRNYMVVHARLDHSIRVPRPDLAARLGTPDACTTCHAGKSPAWAASATAKWYGHADSVTPMQRYAEAIRAGQETSPAAPGLLVSVASDTSIPPIARATAVSLMGINVGPRTLGALQTALADPAPRVRRSAAEVIEAVEPEMRLKMGAPLLTDTVRSVRLATVSALASVPAAQWTSEDRKLFDRGLAEYRAAQAVDADRPEAHVNLGGIAMDLGQPAEAEAEYRIAIRLSPLFAPAWIQLAEAERLQGREGAADSALRAGLAVNSGSADLHHALGLSLIRQRKIPQALEELGMAAKLAPDNARYTYVYAVALHDTGQGVAAVAVLRRALAAHPNDQALAQALASYSASPAQ
jgi:tetratricopeptide (TPR) repeat protein